MKNKVLVLGLALLFLAVLATPVMAKSSKKFEINFDSDPAKIIKHAEWVLKGDVQHGRNGIMVYENCIATVNGITMEDGTLTKTYSYDINVKGVEPTIPPPPNFRFGKGVLHFKCVTEFADGAFIGNHMISGEFKVMNSGFALPWNSDGYAVYHGTGAYLGWTWVLRDKTINGVAQFESYMLIP